MSTTLQTFGADLRALRRTRRLTLQQLADQLGRSVGWLSQVERDMSEPSLADLRDLAQVLEVPVSMLARPQTAAPQEHGIIARAGTRRSIGARIPGLTEELLSPDLTDDFEMVHSTFEPGSRTNSPVERPTQEVGYMLSGKLDLTIDGQTFTVHPGDSFRLRETAFEWANPYEDPAVAIWVISPPVY